MKLEQKLDSMLPHWPAFNVQFHELTHDGEGWSVNDSWTPHKSVDRETAIAALRSRWEVFKANYLPKALVRDLQDIADCEDEAMLEVDCTAFATLTKGE